MFIGAALASSPSAPIPQAGNRPPVHARRVFLMVLHTDGLDGVKHFALWPLAQAAESCFGSDQWPGNLPVPQGWIEFDVGDIEKATADLKSQGYKLLVATQKEPWGQIVTRLLGPEGLLVGITHTPSMRK